MVAADNAVFGLPEVQRGLTAAGGGAAAVAHPTLPYALAMEAVLTGRRLSAAWCAEHGLINRITSAGEALDAALELASVIAGNGPLAVQASKHVIIESADWTTADMTIAALAAPITASPGVAVLATPEATLTMVPPPCARMWGSAALAMNNAGRQSWVRYRRPAGFRCP